MPSTPNELAAPPTSALPAISDDAPNGAVSRHPRTQRARYQAARHRLTALTGRVRPTTAAFYAWLDARVFPRVVSYATHPLTILATILLLIPLIALASLTTLSLVLGNYTNVVSAAVSSIVLATSLKHHGEVKALHAEHSRRIAAIEARMTSRQTQQKAKD